MGIMKYLLSKNKGQFEAVGSAAWSVALAVIILGIAGIVLAQVNASGNLVTNGTSAAFNNSIAYGLAGLGTFGSFIGVLVIVFVAALLMGFLSMFQNKPR